jgi:hypothetical protein
MTPAEIKAMVARNREKTANGTATVAAPEPAPVSEKPKKKDKPPKPERPQSPHVQPKKPQQQKVNRGRLPDMSRFDFTYDASRTMWHGKLIIPLSDGTHVEFEEECSAVKWLETRLDDCWRRFLRENPELPEAQIAKPKTEDKPT